MQVRQCFLGLYTLRVLAAETEAHWAQLERDWPATAAFALSEALGNADLVEARAMARNGDRRKFNLYRQFWLKFTN